MGNSMTARKRALNTARLRALQLLGRTYPADDSHDLMDGERSAVARDGRRDIARVGRPGDELRGPPAGCGRAA